MNVQIELSKSELKRIVKALKKTSKKSQLLMELEDLLWDEFGEVIQ